MNKTLIALAITAALPVAAQADATLSGSVEATVAFGGTVTMDSSVSLASSEVLANGMTATASVNVMNGADTAGTAGLTGDFGTLTLGSGVDDESGARLGDVAGVMGTIDASSANAVNGATYSGTVAGLSVAVAHGGVTSMGTTMDFNGLTIGLASQGDVTAVGGSYAFGDLTVTAGKANGHATAADNDLSLSAAYSTTVDALTVGATVDQASAVTASVSYTLDGITVTAEYDAGVTSVSGAYTTGDLTVTANSDSEVTAALDLGNADLSVERNAGVTTMTYSVAF
tara:strand:- start:3435 stop:4289 length:855 start_codon:yes stop_codon:yes gene_type:complete